MKATIGVYDSMEKADQAIQKLILFDFPADKLSVFGKHAGEVIEEEKGTFTGEAPHDENKIEPKSKVALAEIATAAVAGTGIGVLTGIGLFAIPGLGFLFGAGALVGAIGGFNFGVIGGGIASALTVLGMTQIHADEYEQHLQEGKYLVIVTGDQDEILKAKEILLEHGTYIHLNHH